MSNIIKIPPYEYI